MISQGHLSSQIGYCVYSVGGRPVLALPRTPRRLRQAGLRYYPTEAPKRRLFKRGLGLAMWMGMDQWLCQQVVLPQVARGFDLAAWIGHVRGDLGCGMLAAAVVWPPPARSTGRVYVHLLEHGGDRVAFAKLALGAYDRQQVGNETRSLLELHGIGCCGFCVPKVLGCGEFQGVRYLVLEPLPTDATWPLAPWELVKRNVVSVYAGAPRRIGWQDLEELWWWRRYRQHAQQVGRFAAELDEQGGRDVSVCRAHGDLAPHNVLWVRDQLWVYDWEEASNSAPVLTDEICFFLAVHHKVMERDPRSGLKLLAQRFGLDGPGRRDVMMGLAFLHGAGVRAAQEVLKHWT